MQQKKGVCLRRPFLFLEGGNAWAEAGFVKPILAFLHLAHTFQNEKIWEKNKGFSQDSKESGASEKTH
ncbi:MAG: hypothetical protein IKX79_04940 [Desulfovibrionaceae bacterium]|nr:hypothetical protein [Desulfovibrionaceae bacterium]